jgi:23S rRNA pseudoU1915 N3-methylase RlmH
VRSILVAKQYEATASDLAEEGEHLSSGRLATSVNAMQQTGYEQIVGYIPAAPLAPAVRLIESKIACGLLSGG